MKNEIDKKIVENNFIATKKRSERLLKELESGSTTNLQVIEYYLFEDMLRIAGYGKALEELDENDIIINLRLAAEHALNVYKLKNTTINKIGYLQSSEEDVFIDESMTNPWVYIRAIYASAASSSLVKLNEIISLPTQMYKSEQIKVQPIVNAYLVLLIDLISKILSKKKIEEFMTFFQNSKNQDDIFWYLQAEVIEKIFLNDRKGTDLALEKLEFFLNAYYSQEKYRNNPEAFLDLVLLGLKGIRTVYDISDDLHID
ncbi:MAG: hypothetical protein QM737_15455 [Ferruginibacter sp.]